MTSNGQRHDIWGPGTYLRIPGLCDAYPSRTIGGRPVQILPQPRIFAIDRKP